MGKNRKKHFNQTKKKQEIQQNIKKELDLTFLQTLQEQEKLKEEELNLKTITMELSKIPELDLIPKANIYIIDTSALIHNPILIKQLSQEKCLIVIPLVVLEEIDKLKLRAYTQRNAHEVGAYLFEYLNNTSSLKGLYNINKAQLVFTSSKDNNNITGFDPEYNDNIILDTAIRWMGKYPNNKTFLISKDVLLSVKANILGLDLLEDIQKDHLKKGKDDFEKERFYPTIRLSTDNWTKLVNNELMIDEIETNLDLYPNQILKTNSNNKEQLLLVKNNKVNLIQQSYQKKNGSKKLAPRNLEQALALEILTDKNIKLVFLLGKAGTGKTLLALHMGLEHLNKNNYERVIIARPIVSMGNNDIGFLPGDANAKLNPWMQPIYDNLEILLPRKINDIEIHSKEELIKNDLLEIASLSHIRGRSIPNQYMIIDEAQNLTPHDIYTIITRAGENTKLVFTGDPWQIDNQYVDFTSNGLTVWSEKAKTAPFAVSVLLTSGVRSKLAEWASSVF